MKPTQYISRQKNMVWVQVPYLFKGQRLRKTKVLYREDFINEKELFEEAVWWRNYFVDRFGREYQEYKKSVHSRPVPRGSCLLIEQYGIYASVRKKKEGDRLVVRTSVSPGPGKIGYKSLIVDETNFRDKIEVLIIMSQQQSGVFVSVDRKMVNKATRRFKKWVKDNDLWHNLKASSYPCRKTGLHSWLTKEEKQEIYKKNELDKTGVSKTAFLMLDDASVDYCVKASAYKV